MGGPTDAGPPHAYLPLPGEWGGCMSMTVRQLHDLLEEVPDTREIVLRSAEADGLLAAWRAADREAGRALAAWRTAPGREAFVAYRAASDRADAAQEALDPSG